MARDDGPLLEVQAIHTYYGLSHILHGVSLTVGAGEAVAFLGRNGAGKTTTLKSIAGVLHPRGGRVVFRGDDISGLPPHEIVQRGIAWIPEERRIFPNLTVYENLKMGRLVVDGGRQMDGYLDRVFALFPRLKDRVHHKGKGSTAVALRRMLPPADGLAVGHRLPP